MPRETKHHPLGNALFKAYRSTNAFQLDMLLKEESRWKRKQTIANNKLEAVRLRINKLAESMTERAEIPAQPEAPDAKPVQRAD